MKLNSTLIILAIAALLSAIGVYLMMNYVNTELAARQQAAPILAAPVRSVALVGVPVRIEGGSIIDENHIQAMQVPEEVAQQDDYVPWQDHQTLIGKRLRSTLLPNMAIKYTDITDGKTAVLSNLLKPGEKAMTIAADAFSTFYGFLQPQDHIDILLVQPQQKALPLLDNIQVLATDLVLNPLQKQDEPHYQLANSGELNTITLRVSQQQAQKIALALTQGSLVMLLRAQQDFSISSTPITQAQDVIGLPQVVEMIIGGSK